VLSLQLVDRVSTPEPLRQHMDDRGIDIIDAIAQVSKSTPPSGERVRDHDALRRGRGGHIEDWPVLTGFLFVCCSLAHIDWEYLPVHSIESEHIFK
jgi:hypothetical protein